jgi:hypothetical protein
MVHIPDEVSSPIAASGNKRVSHWKFVIQKIKYTGWESVKNEDFCLEAFVTRGKEYSEGTPLARNQKCRIGKANAIIF